MDLLRFHTYSHREKLSYSSAILRGGRFFAEGAPAVYGGCAGGLGLAECQRAVLRAASERFAEGLIKGDRPSAGERPWRCVWPMVFAEGVRDLSRPSANACRPSAAMEGDSLRGGTLRGDGG